MKVGTQHYRTVWKSAENVSVDLIDQRWLPHRFEIESVSTPEEMVTAIRDMHVRGAGAIGAAAGFGMYLATLVNDGNDWMETVRQSAKELKEARPTAINLEWAVDRQLSSLSQCQSSDDARVTALTTAQIIADEDVEFCRMIGVHGLTLIEDLRRVHDGRTLHILTHCNAGWLAFVDHGTATSPIYAAHNAGIDIHVWVDETRPRNQGGRLTAWELDQHGVPYTVITDNAGGHLMQHGRVDMVIVGSDRTSVTGYATNKIGTYLKALAAFDNGIPFYVALPSSTIDWNMRDGLLETPIEERSGDEVRYAQGLLGRDIERVLLTAEHSPVMNAAFDVTPPRLITGLITERGIVKPEETEIRSLYPEKIQV